MFTEMEVRRFMFNLDARFTSATDRDASMACGVLGGSAEDIPREEYTSGSAGEPRSENTAACGHGGSGRVSSGRGEHRRVSDPPNEGHDAVPPAFAESRNTWTYLRGARRYIDGMKHVVARCAVVVSECRRRDIDTGGRAPAVFLGGTYLTVMRPQASLGVRIPTACTVLLNSCFGCAIPKRKCWHARSVS